MGLLKFSDEHKLFHKTLNDFIDREIRPHAEEWEMAGVCPRELWQKCGQLGLFGAHYPESLGGMGGDFTYTLMAFEALGGCGSSGVALGLAVQSDMATPALARHGSEKLRQDYLIPALQGKMIASIAISEPDYGSDVAGIRTRAQLKGDHWIINGAKTFITNGTQADFLTLLARTSEAPGHKGLSLFIVPTDLPGLERGKGLRKTCYPSSDTAEIVLQDVKVPDDHLIGQEGKGFIYQMEQFQLERLAGAALGLGAMKRSYVLTRQYVEERQVFGMPLAKMQVTRHKLAQIASEITCLEALTHRCVAIANQGQDFTKEVSMLKLLGAQALMRVTEECVQLHGGNGLMQEYEVARYFRDAKLMGIGAGANEVMKEIICKYEGME